MSKLHISLVGGQPMPSYTGIIDDSPEAVILVYSLKSERQADTIAKAVQEKLNISCRKVEFDAFDLASIWKKLQLLSADINEEDTVTINLSSGSKPWSILFHDFFKQRKNAKCIFIDQNNLVWDMENYSSRKLDYSPDMAEIFSLNGTKLKKHTDYSIFTEEDFKAISQIRAIRQKNIGAFKRTTQCFTANPYHNEYHEDPQGNSYISWNEQTNSFHCEIERYNHKIEYKDISSPNIKRLMLSSGWFELDVTHFLSQWNMAKEIWMNCEFVVKQSNNEQTQNEIDIIINTGDKMLFVECKTQIHTITDIDKFNNSVRTYGGLAAKRIFFTDGEMKEEAREKCQNVEMPYFSLQELKNDAVKSRNFFEWLTNEMKQSNKNKHNIDSAISVQFMFEKNS